MNFHEMALFSVTCWRLQRGIVKLCDVPLRFLQSPAEPGVSLMRLLVPDRIPDSLSLSDHHHDLLRPGHRGVQQVPLQHHEMSHQERQDQMDTPSPAIVYGNG